ncbi:MAG: carboxypeptidase-like regulatory domain-containing protein [Bacteroidota bacterium]
MAISKKLSLLFFLCVSVFVFSNENQITVYGTVTDGKEPMPGVSVMIKGTSVGQQTDSNGKYSINAQVGDVLVYSYAGMVPMEIITEDVTSILNIELVSKVEQLNEVVVKKKRTNKQSELRRQYSTNKNLLKTAFGIIDKERSGYAIRSVEGSDLNLSAVDFLSALRLRFPSLKIVNNTGSPFPQVFTRGIGSLNAVLPVVYDVDGMILRNPPLYLQIADIDRIALVPSLMGSMRYLDAGGVIIINTKLGNFQSKLTGDGPHDQAKRRDNFFEDDVLDQEDLLVNAPTYVKQFRKAENEQEAISIYEKNFKAYGNSYHFSLDAYDYFLGRWDNNGFADRILKENNQLFEDNPLALKALAYVHQKHQDYKKANELYKEIFILRPQYGQSYLDMARSYREIGAYNKAAAICTRYNYLVDEGFVANTNDTFTTLIKRELNNLLVLHGEQFLTKKQAKEYTFEDGFSGTRLVFEWNDSEAEFELQFVEPGNQFYTWNHTHLANAERLKNEKLVGYAMEEYLIDEGLKGNWNVNIRYKGNKKLTPTYLKATVYYNYGSIDQRKETKVFKLRIKDINQNLFSVVNRGAVASR